MHKNLLLASIHWSSVTHHNVHQTPHWEGPVLDPCNRGRLKRSATIWASGRTRDPYFEILGAPRGIMVTRSGGFEF